MRYVLVVVLACAMLSGLAGCSGECKCGVRPENRQYMRLDIRDPRRDVSGLKPNEPIELSFDAYLPRGMEWGLDDTEILRQGIEILNWGTREKVEPSLTIEDIYGRRDHVRVTMHAVLPSAATWIVRLGEPYAVAAAAEPSEFDEFPYDYDSPDRLPERNHVPFDWNLFLFTTQTCPHVTKVDIGHVDDEMRIINLQLSEPVSSITVSGQVEAHGNFQNTPCAADESVVDLTFTNAQPTRLSASLPPEWASCAYSAYFDVRASPELFSGFMKNGRCEAADWRISIGRASNYGGGEFTVSPFVEAYQYLEQR